MSAEWQEAAVNARIAMRATQEAALQTLRAARASGSLESEGHLLRARAALREVTRWAAALKAHPPPGRPTAIVQCDAAGHVLRVSVEGG